MSRQLLSLGIAAGILIPNIVLAQPVVIQQGSISSTAVSNNNSVDSGVDRTTTHNQSASDRND